MVHQMMLLMQKGLARFLICHNWPRRKAFYSNWMHHKQDEHPMLHQGRDGEGPDCNCNLRGELMGPHTAHSPAVTAAAVMLGLVPGTPIHLIATVAAE